MGTLGQSMAIAPKNEQLGELMMTQNNSILTKTQVIGKSELLIEIETIAHKYGISGNRFLKLIKCESSLNTEAVGDNGKAYSLLQFHESTFNLYCKGNYYNYHDQLVCGAQMISSGLSYHWTCQF